MAMRQPGSLLVKVAVGMAVGLPINLAVKLPEEVAGKAAPSPPA